VLDCGLLHSLKPAKRDVDPDELHRLISTRSTAFAGRTPPCTYWPSATGLRSASRAGPELFTDSSLRDVFKGSPWTLVDLKPETLIGPLAPGWKAGDTRPAQLAGRPAAFVRP
jgi:hypothetical protein